MKRLVTVSTAAEATALTTLERVKMELGITGTDYDDLLTAKISEASSDIEAVLGYRVARETVSEMFWDLEETLDYVLLDRVPVSSVTTVTLDDEVQETTYYRLDGKTGALYALDGNGYQSAWIVGKSLVVAYIGGYLLPGQAGRDLPPAIEAGAVDLVSMFWLARGRDPSLRAEQVDGVGRAEYWVGSVGAEGALPTSVLQKISPFARPRIF